MNIASDFIGFISHLEKELGIGESYDVEVREIKVFSKQINIYYLSGLADGLQAIKIIESILSIPRERDYSFDLIKDNISHHAVTVINDLSEVFFEILNGMLLLIFEGYNQVLSVDVRSYPTRSIDEPDMEKVIRGAHDGFTENFHTNVTLVRRRIKDPKLRNEIYKIGKASPTSVCLSYIKDICPEDTLQYIKDKLHQVKVQHLIMADKALEELLIHQRFNPYPLVRYTERADTVAVHLYQGMFALFVDTSPSVILAPATFADHIQHTEEYRQTPLAGTYLRLIRYFGILVSLFLTPIWLALVKAGALSGILSVLAPNQAVTINIYLQVLAAEVGVEFLRMASIHTPNALSTAMRLIAGILLGDIAVAVGLFAIQTVLLVALSAIGTYVTPSYELGLANKISKLFFIFSVFVFGYWGLIMAALFWFIYLCRLKSVKKPYLYPLVPFNFKRLLKILIRYPYQNEKTGG
ncbi:MAG: spore germination protein [Bacilli bacterium]|nr:spore germination protein [Bacilli bacterium]